MQHLAADTRRTTTTPNATMTTLASPTLGGAGHSLWLVEMNPLAEGPVHAFDAEVVWAVTRGSGELRADGTSTTFAEGDTLVLEAGVLRQLVAGEHGFASVVTCSAPATITRGDGSPAMTPAWSPEPDSGLGPRPAARSRRTTTDFRLLPVGGRP